MSILDGQMPIPNPLTCSCGLCGTTYRIEEFHQCSWPTTSIKTDDANQPPPMHPIKWRTDNDKLAAENAALKAEVERWRKVGGRMQVCLQPDGSPPSGDFPMLCDWIVDEAVKHADALAMESLANGARVKSLTAEVERLHGLWVEAGDARIQLEEDVRTLRAENAKLRADAELADLHEEPPPMNSPRPHTKLKRRAK